MLRGLDVEEALDATHRPCCSRTLYRRVEQARAQIRESAQNVTLNFLEKDAVDIIVRGEEGNRSGVSSLSPSPNKRRKSDRFWFSAAWIKGDY